MNPAKNNNRTNHNLCWGMDVKPKKQANTQNHISLCQTISLEILFSALFWTLWVLFLSRAAPAKWTTMYCAGPVELHYRMCLPATAFCVLLINDTVNDSMMNSTRVRSLSSLQRQSEWPANYYYFALFVPFRLSWVSSSSPSILVHAIRHRCSFY